MFLGRSAFSLTPPLRRCASAQSSLSTLEDFCSVDLSEIEQAKRLIKLVNVHLVFNLNALSSYPSLEPSIIKLYSSTAQRIQDLLESPTLLPRNNANDRKTVRNVVKDVLTRHSTAGSTIEWLYDYASERMSEGNSLPDVSAVLSRHFTITLLCDHYVGSTDPIVPRGAVKRASSVLDLIEDVRYEALFASAVAFPDSAIDISIPDDDPDGLPSAFYVIPSWFRYVLMELVKNAVSASRGALVETAVTDGKLVVTVRDSGPGLSSAREVFAFGHASRRKYDRLDVQTSYAMPPSDPLSGVGVGLALSKIIANKYGGDVTVVNNTPGEGGGATAALSITLDPHHMIIT